MTAFTTRCSGRVFDCLRVLTLAIVFVCLPEAANADAKVRSAAMIATDEGYVVNADFQLRLNPVWWMRCSEVSRCISASN